MFFVYILHSPKLDKYYTGQTYSLEKRLMRHLSKTTLYTSRADDWRLVYFEEFPTRKEALKRERYIKSRKSKKYIAQLVESRLPEGDGIYTE